MIYAAKPHDVIIRPIFDPDRSRGGIILPQESRQRCTQGIVKYIGSAVIDVKVGDRVGFGGYSGTLAKLEDEGIFIIMPDKEIDFVFGPPSNYDFPLYFKGEDGEYYKMTYEQIFEVVANEIPNMPNYRDFYRDGWKEKKRRIDEHRSIVNG